MHSNLVGSSRVWNSTDYADFVSLPCVLHRSSRRSQPTNGSHKPSLNVKFSLCGRAGWMNHLFEPDRRVAMSALSVQGGINERVFPFGPAPDNGQIFLLQLSPLHQQPESARNGGFLRHQNEAAGFAIEPIHYGYLAAGSNFEREESAQFLPQSSHAIRFRGMNQEKRRFIDDSVIVGFIDDCEIE